MRGIASSQKSSLEKTRTFQEQAGFRASIKRNIGSKTDYARNFGTENGKTRDKA
jgi:hypothetical protein